jgi:hypothetical protein
MPYDDDDDLFGEEFDFVDEDDSDVEDEAPKGKKKKVEDEEPPAKSRRRPAPKAKPAPERPRTSRAKPASPAPTTRRAPRPPVDEPPVDEPAPEPVMSAPPIEEEEEVALEAAPAPQPTGPPSDHVVHIYEFGKLKRTIPRKFTDEEAVGFAEEYTRTGKSYGRYAVATPEDEEPSQTFAGASRGN